MYKAQVKHIEKVLVEMEHPDLGQMLIHLQEWRAKSNTYQDYDLYITDDDISIFGSRF